MPLPWLSLTESKPSDGLPPHAMVLRARLLTGQRLPVGCPPPANPPPDNFPPLCQTFHIFKFPTTSPLIA